LADFGVAWQPTRGYLLVTVFGEIDMDTAPELANALLQAEVHLSGLTSLVLDIGGVTFLGSAGINVMVACHQRCRAARVSFMVAGAQPTVARVLRITAVDTVLQLVATPPGVPVNPS
jgi:anti-anti-sigma factor